MKIIGLILQIDEFSGEQKFFGIFPNGDDDEITEDKFNSLKNDIGLPVTTETIRDSELEDIKI